MRHIGKHLTSLLLLPFLSGAAMAQSALPEDPLSELVQSLNSSPFESRGYAQLRPAAGTVQIARRRAPERMRHSPKADMTRTIRAKAEITIVDEDQVIVRLTRRGIGDIKGPSPRR